MSERIHAPELSGAVDWLNVPAPLTLADLRGKAVLLDFWTYGCINCLHVLPDLRRLEEKYGDELVVIGVHSAKFTNERRTDNLRRIIVRYDIDHPVANDANFVIWKAYGARAWPTMVLIDPEGYIVGTASGEGKGDAFDRAIAAVVAVFDEQGKIDRTPIARSAERERLTTSALAFPGKVLADAGSGSLFIADSNHHRVVIAESNGTVTDVIGGLRTGGSGRVGFDDGPFEVASFYRPQGLALDGNRLYIADTENHAVRVADLTTRRVTTLAGNGMQARWGAEGGMARTTSLNSPWDVHVKGALLFVAMAGSHQIWMIDLQRQLALPYAGSGREARVDGPADEAAFAQPSGLASDESSLYVADSESNIIRAIRLPPLNAVRTLAGGDLFDWGDRDGRGETARFQHPLGLVYAGGLVFVADTYNHRIRTVNPETGDVRTIAGIGRQGRADGPGVVAEFDEPGGISVANGTLYVADTNNHAVRTVTLPSAEVGTISLRFPA